MRPLDRERVGSCLENHRNPRRTRSPHDHRRGVDRSPDSREASVCSGLAAFHTREIRTTNELPSTYSTLVQPCSTVPEGITFRSSAYRPMISQPGVSSAFYTAPFPNWPEEPAFSRRRPRFGESVQPAAGSSPAVIRCEPTSDVPVAAAPSIRHAALDCGYAPRRSSCESGLVSRVCIRRSSVKKTGLEQTRTSSIA